MKKQSEFRLWVARKWYEHLDEMAMYGIEVEHDASVYFNKYKFWLKGLYLFEKRNDIC